MNNDLKTLPVIDTAACIGCEACVRVCPDRILTIDDSGLAGLSGETCMQCGHCYAVCPVDAIDVPFLETGCALSTTGSDSKGKATPVRPEALMELLSMRRSCRCFTGERVGRHILDDLVRAGVTAPSGTNCQPWQFAVLETRADVLELGAATAAYYHRLNRQAARPWLRFLLRMVGVLTLQHYYDNYFETVRQGLDDWEERNDDRLFHGATAAIVVTADARASCPREDALMASQNIVLMAETMGLGTCLIGFVVEAARRDQTIGATLGLEKHQRIYSVIAVGYPDVVYQRPAGRKPVAPQYVHLAGVYNDT